MVRHRPRCRDVLPLLKLWPNEPKSVHLDILDRRSNISNRRLSCEKLLASGQENVTDGTALWGFGLVKSTSYSHTSQSHSCFGSCSYTIWSIFDEANLFSEMELLGCQIKIFQHGAILQYTILLHRNEVWPVKGTGSLNAVITGSTNSTTNARRF